MTFSRNQRIGRLALIVVIAAAICSEASAQSSSGQAKSQENGLEFNGIKFDETHLRLLEASSLDTVRSPFERQLLVRNLPHSFPLELIVAHRALSENTELSREEKAKHHAIRGRILFAEGAFDLALQDLTESHRLVPDQKVSLWRIATLRRFGRSKPAITAINALMDGNNDTELLSERAAVREVLGQSDLALADMRRAVAADSSYQGALDGLMERISKAKPAASGPSVNAQRLAEFEASLGKLAKQPAGFKRETAIADLWEKDLRIPMHRWERVLKQFDDSMKSNAQKPVDASKDRLVETSLKLLSFLREDLRSNASQPQAKLASGSLVLGTVLVRCGNSLALEQLVQAANNDPTNQLALLELCRVNWDRGLVLEAATRLLDLKNPQGHRYRADILVLLGVGSLGLASTNYLVAQADADAYDWMLHSKVLVDQEKHDAALAAADKAVSLEPQLADTHVNRGAVLLAHHQFEKALESFDRALSFDKKRIDAHRSRAFVFERMAEAGPYSEREKRREQAASALDDALKQIPQTFRHQRNRQQLERWRNLLRGIEEKENLPLFRERP